MNEETINKIVEEHYGFTVEEIDNMVGNLSLKINQLQHNWNELKKWLEEEEQEYRKDSYSGEYGWIIGTMVRVLNKIKELEEGGNNE